MIIGSLKFQISYGYFLDVIDEFANPMDKNSSTDDILSSSNVKLYTEEKGSQS
jgi:hypothetical protein